jgi:hypothetical protein
MRARLLLLTVCDHTHAQQRPAERTRPSAAASPALNYPDNRDSPDAYPLCKKRREFIRELLNDDGSE